MSTRNNNYQKEVQLLSPSESPISRPPSDYVTAEKKLSIFASPIEGMLLIREGWKPIGGRKFVKIKHDPGYFGTDYKQSAKVVITTRCEKCGETFSYQYEVGYESDQPIEQRKLYKKAIFSTPEPRKCPNCWQYQKWMKFETIKKYISDSLKLTVFLILLGPLTIGFIEYLIWKPRFSATDFLPFTLILIPWFFSLIITVIVNYFSQHAIVNLRIGEKTSQGGWQFYKLVFLLFFPVATLIFAVTAIITIIVAILVSLGIAKPATGVIFPTFFVSVIALGASIMINLSTLPKPTIGVNGKAIIGIIIIAVGILSLLYSTISNNPSLCIIPIICLMFGIAYLSDLAKRL